MCATPHASTGRYQWNPCVVANISEYFEHISAAHFKNERVEQNFPLLASADTLPTSKHSSWKILALHYLCDEIKQHMGIYWLTSINFCFTKHNLLRSLLPPPCLCHVMMSLFYWRVTAVRFTKNHNHFDAHLKY